MNHSNPPPSREDVLYAFAVEPDTGRPTLERYLRDYPAYALELIDLSRERSRFSCEDDQPLSVKDQRLIDAMWKNHLRAAPGVILDPLLALETTQLRELAQNLGVPRQVITAFRERRVLVASVPRRFLRQMASAIHTSVEQLMSALALGPTLSAARSYKSEGKPLADTSVSFERLLVEAGVSEEGRIHFMAEDD